MKKKVLPIIIFVVALGVLSVSAQKTYTPEKGSKERSAILNALRLPIEKKLKQKVQFAIQNVNVQGNWAFINGEPQNMNGGQPDYTGTDYQEEFDEGMFDNNFQALLKKTNGKWKVITYAVGCTDVCYIGWDKQYKAPKAIFPYTE